MNEKNPPTHHTTEPVSSGILRPHLDAERAIDTNAEYRALNTVFTQFNSVIPATGLEVFAPKRMDKAREFYHKGPSRIQTLTQFVLRPFGKQHSHPNQVDRVRETLSTSFSETDQGQILAAANDFLGTVSSHMEADNRDGIPYGQLDTFLVGFPENVIQGLGEHATPENIAKVFQLGSQAAHSYVKKAAESEYSFLNESLGDIVELIGEEIPAVIGRAVEGNGLTLPELEEYVSKHSVHSLKNYVAHHNKPKKEPTPADVRRIERLENNVLQLDPNMNRAESPFNRKDDEPWELKSFLGMERRRAEYGDLGAMARKTEQDNGEFGLVISTDSEGNPISQYLRGAEESIKNKAEQREYPQNIFFHSHPSNTETREPVAPLVSGGDLLATQMSDYGGGYLNVACANGLTLHVGASTIPERKGRLVYTVESGEMAGERIAPNPGKKTQEVMTQVNSTQEPYTYSIVDGTRKLFFLHMPWKHIEASISLSDLCFGDGLAQTLQRFSDLPVDMPRSSNLHTALVATKQLR